jgi:hypothetical protein
MSRVQGYITARFRDFILRHPANALGLPAEVQKYRKSTTLPVQATKAHRGSTGTIPLILYLGATWRRVNFTPRLLYLRD